MANPNAAFGLRPIRHITGAPYNGQANIYELASSDGTAAFIGDVVKLTQAGDSVDGTPVVTPVNGTSDRPVGVIVSFVPVLTNLTQTTHLASTKQKVYVADDPGLIFACQSDGTLAASDMGKYANIATGSGSTYTGVSAMQLHESSVTGTASTSLPLKIERMYLDNNNVLGANGIVEVSLITHINRTATAV